jgi:hypothetical protein
MEKVKDPAMLMACISLLGTVGGGTYFYKQLETIRLEQERMNNHLSKLTERVTSLEGINNGRQENVAELNKQVKEVNRRLDEIPRLDTVFNELEIMDRDLDDLVYDLQERSIEVHRSSKESQSRRSGNRHGKYRESADEIQKNRLGKINNQRPYSEPKTPLYQTTHQTHHAYQQPYPQSGYPSPNYQPQPAQPALQPQPAPQLFDDGDDQDLINHVRTQHK